MQWIWLGYMGWIFGQLEPDLQASHKYLQSNLTYQPMTNQLEESIGLDWTERKQKLIQTKHMYFSSPLKLIFRQNQSKNELVPNISLNKIM